MSAYTTITTAALSHTGLLIPRTILVRSPAMRPSNQLSIAQLLRPRRVRDRAVHVLVHSPSHMLSINELRNASVKDL
jgi:ribosomal protein L30/L7E